MALACLSSISDLPLLQKQVKLGRTTIAYIVVIWARACKDLQELVPSIIVVRAFTVSDTAFAVRDTVTRTFGIRRLHLVHCSRETIVAFYISAPNVCDTCNSTQKWFQTVAGIYGNAQRKCVHSGAIFQ